MIHKPHLPSGGSTVYCGISGEQFHGSRASYSATDEACGSRSSTWRSHVLGTWPLTLAVSTKLWISALAPLTVSLKSHFIKVLTQTMMSR